MLPAWSTFPRLLVRQPVKGALGSVRPDDSDFEPRDFDRAQPEECRRLVVALRIRMDEIGSC